MKAKNKFVEKDKNKVVEVSLRCDNQTMNTHIEYRFKGKTIKAGMCVELKDDARMWMVEKVYGDPVDKNTIHNDWHNNI